MRRKSSGGYQHKRRYQGSGGGGQNHGGGGNRPRRNYGASREKYLNQARDALASGDRVMAEYFYQHADHCYRMMVEEGHRPNQNNSPRQPQDGAEGNSDGHSDSDNQGNSNALPAFITASYEGQNKPVDPSTIQNWEDRDA